MAAVAVVLALAGGMAAAGCTSTSRAPGPTVRPPAPGPAPPRATTTATLESATTTSTTPALVPWSGPVEHLFFHSLIVHPGMAFTKDRLARGFRDYFVTVSEFRAILDQLYANGWTLVDIHRAVTGSVEVPRGRRPLVLSEDDVNYYDYSRHRGLGWRLVLDPAGDVKVEVRDARGVRATDDDIVPILDAFVTAHPAFSASGAKGVLALTGYEGLLGERVNDQASPEWPASVARAKALVARLRATGWTFASHSYGHIDLTKTTVAQARSDTLRWMTEAAPIIGPTDVYIYPFGAAPPSGSATVQMLRGLGFTVLCDIDAVPRLVRVDGVTIMSRRHIDGIAFAQEATVLAHLFDVSTVEDIAARRT